MSLYTKEIETYCEEHSLRDNPLLLSLIQTTYAKAEGPNMLSGPLVGQFLQLLIRLSNAKIILDIGTYTGYSALQMAEALPEDGRITTIDINPATAPIAESFIKQSPHQHKINIVFRPALSFMKELVDESLDFIFVDADKQNYPLYFQEGLRLLRTGKLMVFDNMLWGGQVLNPQDMATTAIDETNHLIRTCPDIAHILLPIRDGIHVVQKK